MNLKPINQRYLYGLDSYLNEFIKMYKDNKLPNKILLSGDKGIGKCTLAYHLVNYVLSKDDVYPYNINKFEIHKDNKSFKLTTNGSNPDQILIDTVSENGSVNIDQIRVLISRLNKSSFNDKERFVIIDNIESLNINSTNALLKILEEPPSNIFFILINNDRSILPTLKSRCINFRIFLSHKKIIAITNKLLNGDIYKCLNDDLLNYFSTPGYFYKFVSFFKSNNHNLIDYDIKSLLRLIIKENLYKKDVMIKDIAFEYFELFCRKRLSTNHFKNFDFYSYFLKRIDDTKKFNLDNESLFIEFEHKMLNG